MTNHISMHGIFLKAQRFLPIVVLMSVLVISLLMRSKASAQYSLYPQPSCGYGYMPVLESGRWLCRRWSSSSSYAYSYSSFSYPDDRRTFNDRRSDFCARAQELSAAPYLPPGDSRYQRMMTEAASWCRFPWPPDYDYSYFSSGDCACLNQYNPVCGADGRTYPSACKALCERVRIVHSGVCNAFSSSPSCYCPQVYQPVCGRDGQTYANACTAQCRGVAMWYTGSCVEQYRFGPDVFCAPIRSCGPGYPACPSGSDCAGPPGRMGCYARTCRR